MRPARSPNSSQYSSVKVCTRNDQRRSSTHCCRLANGSVDRAIVNYLGHYDVPINVLFFEYLVDDNREYLARSWLTDPGQASSAGGGSTTKKQPPWNGTDFFVAVGESDHRNWHDMRR